MAAPVAFLGLRGSFLLLLALCAACVAASLIAVVRELFGSGHWVELGSIAGIVFGWDAVGASVRNVQPGALILLLLTAAWLLLRRQRDLAAGAAVGVAACLQAFPAMLLLYFAVRRRRAFLSAALTILLLCAVSYAVTPPRTFEQWFATTSVVSETFGPQRHNLSLFGVLFGFSHGMGWNWNWRLAMGAPLLGISGLLIVFLRLWKPVAPALERLDVEYSMVVVGMLLASPIAWPRYLPILLLPVAVLIEKWSRAGRHPLPALFLALWFMTIPTQSIEALHAWLARILGFPTSWLLTSVETFALVGLLLWLQGVSRKLTEGFAHAAAAAAN